MQQYAPIAGTESLQESLSRINNNNLTIRSNFSGDTLPNDRTPGQICWHTSDKILYVCNPDNEWEPMFSTLPGTTGHIGSSAILSGQKASESNYGLVKKATNAETVGTSVADRAVSFKGLYNKSASQSLYGVAKLSTDTPSGTDVNTMITPKGAKYMADSITNILGYIYNDANSRGYLRTKEGLLIQWGTVSKENSYRTLVTEYFQTSFIQVFSLVVHSRDPVIVNNHQEGSVLVSEYNDDRAIFLVGCQGDNSWSGAYSAHWVAIGI